MNIGKIILLIFIFSLIGYIIGSILFGLLISRTKRVDIRNLGSGNVGATNVTRNIGKTSGIIVMLLDFFKSWISTFICLIIYRSFKGWLGNSHFEDFAIIIYIGGFFAVIGHCFPISYFYALIKYKFNFDIAKKYSGGKGVSSAAGFAASISPWMFFICFILFWSICLITKYVSLSSIITVFLLPFWTLIPQLDFFYMMGIKKLEIITIPSFSKPFDIVNIFNYHSMWWYILVLFSLELCVSILVIFRHKENIIRLINKKENKAFSKKK